MPQWKKRKPKIDTRERALDFAIEKAIAEANKQGRASYANRNQTTGNELLDSIKEAFEAGQEAKGNPMSAGRSAALDAWDKITISGGFSFAVNLGVQRAQNIYTKRLEKLKLPEPTNKELQLIKELAEEEFLKKANMPIQMMPLGMGV
ncbi:hypothetical protein [Kiloniella sp.]|uniref:hypothetical protein n=1 Tax=Kiloniella sp. TaxID=1938587 RepID=UPI003A8E3251